jgi:hypothetical protein
VCSTHETGKPIVLVNINRDHQIESEQRQVGEVVLSQTLATKMCMHTTQPTKAIYRHANALEVRQLDSLVVTDHHVFDVTAAID